MSTPALAAITATRRKNVPVRPRWSHAIKSAQAKRALWVSGPLLDRIDIHVQVPRVPYEKLTRSRVTRSLSTDECRKYLHVDQCPVTP